MGRFQTADGMHLDSICVDNRLKSNGMRKTLHLVYTASDDLVTGGTFLELDVKRGKKQTSFTMKPQFGASGKTYVFPAGDDDVALTVHVGNVTNHANFTVDLFADLLGRSEDPRKLKIYERALAPENNNVPDDKKQFSSALSGQPLMQITHPNPPAKFNCGGHLREKVGPMFGKISLGEPSKYYDTSKLKGSSATQGELSAALNSAKLKQGVDKIKSLLDSKTVVRVFVAHDYPQKVTSGVVQPTGQSHFLLIVGYGTKEGKLFFLCVDPWPGGSRLNYTSGILGNVTCSFLGLLQFTGDTLATPVNVRSGQTFDYLVLAGP